MRLLKLLSGTKSVTSLDLQNADIHRIFPRANNQNTIHKFSKSNSFENTKTQQIPRYHTHIVFWRILRQAFRKNNPLLLCMGYRIRISIIVNTARHMENGHCGTMCFNGILNNYVKTTAEDTKHTAL